MSPAITVAVARDPKLVRTVRLVAAAVARRAGRDEQFVEEVRLAVGEACGLFVSVDSDTPVTVRLDVADRFVVAVEAAGPLPPPVVDGVEPWAVLRGLTDEFSLVEVGDRTTVELAWALS
jgi:hypothetical protein